MSNEVLTRDDINTSNRVFDTFSDRPDGSARGPIDYGHVGNIRRSPLECVGDTVQDRENNRDNRLLYPLSD